ncbi:MAG: DNA translocase FtsK, partial [Oscillospiraceae bacterium]|nr:DNA translocase FtsK [Oscillospiraceae bacterium]
SSAASDVYNIQGDMLYLPNGQPKPVRVQGCYVSTAEIERVVKFIKSQSTSDYDESIIQAVDQLTVSTPEDKSASGGEEPEIDEDAALIDQAIEVVVAAGQASTSNLQRRLRLGYGRAARIMDELEKMGIIGPYEGAKPRRVLLTKEQLNERKLRNMK